MSETKELPPDYKVICEYLLDALAISITIADAAEIKKRIPYRDYMEVSNIQRLAMEKALAPILKYKGMV